MSGLNGCSTASDTASNPDPLPFWGRIDCQDSSRVKQITTGGDQHLTGTGEAQGDDAFRRTTVYDGDDYYGERCELGLNDKDAPNAFYHEGERKVTYISLRLGANVDPNSDKWRTVMQMKQAQPYVNPVVAPVLELEVHTGEWWFTNSWNGLWSAPAQANTWTRFAFDIVYSTNPTVGSITIHADLNGDGDSSDAHESSPAYHVATLVPETAGSQWYAPGGSIPDHLRAGIYQNPAHNCPSGCSVDVDNVQVVEPK